MPAKLPAASLAGHWEGDVEVPGRPLEITLDLDESEDGVISGAISIPQQGVVSLALAGFERRGAEVGFLLPHTPGDPVFRGTLSVDGRTLAGTLTQAGLTFPFHLARVPLAQ